MEFLFFIVLKTSFYASIVGLIILLAKKIFKNKINAKYGYIIWMLLLIKLIIPFGPQSSISLFNKVARYESQIIENNKSTDKLAYASENESENKIYAGESTNEFKYDEVKNSTSLSEIIKKVATITWVIGVVAFIFMYVVSHILLHNKIKERSKISGDNISNILINCKEKMRINSNIQVLTTDVVQTPSLVGIINPKILLPSTMNSLSDKELEYVFLHELAHYKRKDIIINYTLIALQSIHWFNILIWFYFKKIREDIELATDEKVLNILDDSEHKNYGLAILAVLEKVKYSKFQPGIMGMLDDKKSLKKRLDNIKKMKFFKEKKILVTVVGIVLVIVLGSVLLTSPTNKDTDKVTNESSYASNLYSYKSKYIGDASNISSLVSNLPLSDIRGEIELKTDNEPYGLTINYNIDKSQISREDLDKELYYNSAVIFSLIENVDEINYNINDDLIEKRVVYIRENMNKDFDGDISKYGVDYETFEGLLYNLE